MKLIHRIGYFSVGLFFGIIILIFFLSGKRTSCDYSPTARVLKNIRIKDRVYSEEAIAFFQINNIDTSSVSILLNDGSVDFSRSKTDNEICNVYFVSGISEQQKLELEIENCDSIATIQRVQLLK